jgi:hypothetical protein
MMSSFRTSSSLLLKRCVLRSVSSSLIYDYSKQNHVTLRKAAQIRLFASIPERNEEAMKKEISVKGKFKQIWNRYGFLAIGTYAGLYIMTLGSIFISLDLDLFNAATFGFDPEIAVLKVIQIINSVSCSAFDNSRLQIW